jgi:hypothetical protein
MSQRYGARIAVDDSQYEQHRQLAMGKRNGQLKGFDGLIDTVVSQLRPFQFRGKGRLAELVIPRTGKRNAVIFGSRFSLDLSDYLQRHMYAGSFERVESAVVRKKLRPGMTFVDVGANVGYYTALAARLVGPTGAVFAFEPSDYAFPRLSTMIDTNGLTWVRAIKYGLANVPGEKLLFGAVDEHFCDLRSAGIFPTVIRTKP